MLNKICGNETAIRKDGCIRHFTNSECYQKGGNILDYVLEADALTKIYGHHKALDNFSMHIPQGAIYGLVGKNGAR